MSARFNRSGSAIAGLCLLILIGAACNDDPPGGGFIPAPPVIGGGAETRPGIDGSWEFMLGTGADSCGIEFFPATAEGVLQVTQTDGDTAFGVVNECGTVVTLGTGTAERSGVITFTYEETFEATATCTLALRTEATGTIDVSAGTITGSYTTDVEPRDGFQDCSTTFPCALSGTFTATTCPPAACEFMVCGI